MTVENNFEVLMRKVDFFRGAALFGSPCQQEEARKDVEDTLRTMLSSAQIWEQENIYCIKRGTLEDILSDAVSVHDKGEYASTEIVSYVRSHLKDHEHIQALALKGWL